MQTDVGDLVSFIPVVDPLMRIPYHAYDALLFVFLSIAIIAASARTGFRVWKFRTIEVDDILLIISTVFLIGGVVSAHENRDLTYVQMSLSLGYLQHPPPNIGELMGSFQELDHIGGTFTWLSIFIVKMSFLAFFKKLVSRVQYLETFWWFSLAAVIAGMCVNVGLAFYICPHFGDDIIQVCTVEGMTQREGVYLIVSVIIDIVTDVLIICVPIGLLWRVKIDLRRKLGLSVVCSLSTVMIVIALVRSLKATVQSPLSSKIPPATDSSWLFALMNIEAAVAIVMVSITAFRSMLGQTRNKTQYVAPSEKHSSSAERRHGAPTMTANGAPSGIQMGALPGKPFSSDSEGESVSCSDFNQ